MQRLRTWLREWLGIEALDRQNVRLAEKQRLTYSLCLDLAGQKSVLTVTQPTTTHSVTVTPSEPEFFDPVMGRL
jgi:hypothetical protein